MKLAFYKAFQPKATFLDKSVAIASGGLYSHVELVFPNDVCFSISPRENKGRFKRIKLNPEQWDIIELDSSLNYKQIMKDCSFYLNFKYDYIGALFSVTPFCIQKNSRIFCSEVVSNILNQYFVYFFIEDGCKYSPSRLHYAITNNIKTINRRKYVRIQNKRNKKNI